MEGFCRRTSGCRMRLSGLHINIFCMEHRAGKPRYSPVPDSMKSHWEHHREVRKTTFHDHGYVEGWEQLAYQK